MRNWFTFGDMDSRDFGVYISGSGTFDSPARSYENIAVPGRDGDLLGISHRLQNSRLQYPAFIYKDFNENVAAFRSALLATIGYARLWDSYHRDEYRLAVFKGALDVSPTEKLDAGHFTIEFEVMPQRWLLEGEAALVLWEYDGLTNEEDVALATENDVEIDAATTQVTSATLTNPSAMPSRPLIITTGPGTVTLGDQVVTVDVEAGVVVYIDCEMMDAYSLSGGQMVSENANVSFSGNDFPTLKAGDTGVTYTTAGLEIVPRWWRV